MNMLRSLPLISTLSIGALAGVACSASDPQTFSPTDPTGSAGMASGGSGGEAQAGSGGSAGTHLGQGVPATTVGPAGGTLTGDGVSLQIPGAALADEVLVALTPLAPSEMEALPQLTAPGVVGEAELTSRVYAFTPHGTLFSAPATVELSYTGSGNVVMRLDDENDTTWEVIEGARFADGTASFEVSGFSMYAVATAERECQPATCTSVPSSSQCGSVDDGCGGTIDLQSDCGRPACEAGDTCGENNQCTSCVSTFSCATTTAQCGSIVDNCGQTHDIDAECFVSDCSRYSTCTVDNRCELLACSQPSVVQSNGTGSYVFNQEDWFTVADGYASSRTYDNQDGQYRTNLVIRLTEHANACGRQRANQAVGGSRTAFVSIATITDDPLGADLPAPGTYPLATETGALNVATYRGANAYQEFDDCRPGADQGPDSPEGELVLTTVSPSLIEGSFTYADYSYQTSGTFSVPLLDCDPAPEELGCCVVPAN